MLLADFIKDGTEALESLYPAPEARNIVLWLCEEMLGTKSYTHIIEPSYAIPEDRLPALEASLDRLLMGEPIQHIVGHTEFFGYDFKVSRNVLIPRPETEILVQEMVAAALSAQDEKDDVRMLDLCTGSGCIAWSIAMAVPGVEAIGVDISDAALEMADGQFYDHTMSERGIIQPRFIKADVLDIDNIPELGLFDIVISNPPYIMDSEKAQMRKNVLDYEPALALFVRDDDPLIFYRAVAVWADRLLVDNGVGMVEINETLGEPTKAVYEAAGFKDVTIVKDFYGKERFVRFKK